MKSITYTRIRYAIKNRKDKFVKRLKFFLNIEEVFRPNYCNEFVTVFSHPRSGTHFLEAFIAENFYQEKDFIPTKIGWGHWSNTQYTPDSNRYHKLFGSHIFPTKTLKKIDYPLVYIYRDGRAVAYSIWKTDNFIHPKYKDTSFSDFLRLKLDWKGSPAFKSKEKNTIAEHWEKHVSGWIKYSRTNKNILVVKYEDLIDDPYSIYLKIHSKFFNEKVKLLLGEVDTIREPVGLKPNKAKKNSWHEVFSNKDLIFFKDQLTDDFLIKEYFKG